MIFIVAQEVVPTVDETSERCACHRMLRQSDVQYYIVTYDVKYDVKVLVLECCGVVCNDVAMLVMWLL